ncbi:ribosomal RNA-processing protein 7 homolog A [Leptinotarsa decemlineata]|uniref:ribosomal RNA-processing protein 7 homolog A n=1 Tax=Leptinotarsa decemlineata TaxID=7539 RepID=UPI000C252CDB|nr:ribosomal RNA-processing protein 7 homolog A [Leptinotarsa decemlineata]
MLNTVQGFKVLRLIFSAESTSSHDILIKEHSIRTKDESKPLGQTLFVLNVPPYATEAGLKNAFSPPGKITRVIIEEIEQSHSNRNGFKKAFIVFNKREYLLKALCLKTLKPMSPTERPLKVGLEKWIEEYNSSICDPEELQKRVTNYMKQYDKKEIKSQKVEVVDDEGWTVVTKGGRKPGIARKESVENKLVSKGSKKKELKNFYSFQIRESKMKNIATLRKNFEEAKSKVIQMKNARKFKPY